MFDSSTGLGGAPDTFREASPAVPDAASPGSDTRRTVGGASFGENGLGSLGAPSSSREAILGALWLGSLGDPCPALPGDGEASAASS